MVTVQRLAFAEVKGGIFRQFALDGGFQFLGIPCQYFRRHYLAWIDFLGLLLTGVEGLGDSHRHRYVRYQKRCQTVQKPPFPGVSGINRHHYRAFSEGCDRFDFDVGAQRQRGHGERGTGGPYPLEMTAVDFVELREFAHVSGKETGGFHNRIQ